MAQFYEEFLNREHAAGMIFDVDGTLLDSMPVWHHSGEKYLLTLGIHAPAELGDILFAKTMQQGAEYIRKTYGLEQPEEEIRRGILQVVSDAYRKQVPLKPSVIPFLDRLQAAGIPMAVVTATDRPLVQAAFSRLGLERYFVDIITCTDFGSGKDQPDIFHAAARRMHSRPADTWVVEDGLYAIRTAREAGYRIIGMSDAASHKDEPQIRRLADYFLTDFAMDPGHME